MGEHPFASGHLYLDDGENHNNRHHERTQVRYEYDGKLITVTKSIGDENLYSNAATKIIDEVMVFGVDRAPKRVLNKFAMQANGQGDVDVNQVYVASTKMVHLWNLRIPVDEGLFNNHTVDLLELIFLVMCSVLRNLWTYLWHVRTVFMMMLVLCSSEQWETYFIVTGDSAEI